ncbi:MAG: hypothetical protein KJ064_13265 [Anaerolineae bacterium]|jgi:hypothetical protein|nr:MAG: hypothetical protein F9K27_09005 [Anaerolineae bacterium]MCL4877624.1 hypothetical protein [Anaerolineae bacterium]
MGKGLTYQALFEQQFGFTENDLSQNQAGYITGVSPAAQRIISGFWSLFYGVFPLYSGNRVQSQLFPISVV